LAIAQKMIDHLYKTTGTVILSKLTGWETFGTGTCWWQVATTDKIKNGVEGLHWMI
jgi:hypothetical protein